MNMANNGLDDYELKKQLNMLKNTYLMYEEAKKSNAKNMKNKLKEDGTRLFSKEDIERKMKQIEESQKDALNQYISLGGNPDEITKLDTPDKQYIDKDVMEMLEYNREEETRENVVENNSVEFDAVDDNVNDYIPKNYGDSPIATFDVVPLPSKGECYKNKMDRIPVSYLTARDEDMIISPNLYHENKIIDTILKQKVLNHDVDTMDLLECDREAIILYLRATGYGNEYAITATDNVTGENFNTTVDLSKLTFKPFNLKGDENGYFDFELPYSKKKIKFRFLTHRDIVNLDKADEVEDYELRKEKLKEFVETMDLYIENDKELDKSAKTKIRQAIRTIDGWQENIENKSIGFTHRVTNSLEKSIVSVDNVTDRKMIRDFVRNMNVKDSMALRKYITDNEPGIDYNIEIQKPESLGGGSMKVFLQLDQYIFLNTTS